MAAHHHHGWLCMQWQASSIGFKCASTGTQRRSSIELKREACVGGAYSRHAVDALEALCLDAYSCVVNPKGHSITIMATPTASAATFIIIAITAIFTIITITTRFFKIVFTTARKAKSGQYVFPPQDIHHWQVHTSSSVCGYLNEGPYVSSHRGQRHHAVCVCVSIEPDHQHGAMHHSFM
jgi:hypothetical protein